MGIISYKEMLVQVPIPALQACLENTAVRWVLDLGSSLYDWIVLARKEGWGVERVQRGYLASTQKWWSRRRRTKKRMLDIPDMYREEIIRPPLHDSSTSATKQSQRTGRVLTRTAAKGRKAWTHQTKIKSYPR